MLIGVCRWALGTGGHRWQVLGDLQICRNFVQHELVYEKYTFEWSRFLKLFEQFNIGLNYMFMKFHKDSLKNAEK